jgi:dynein heavy chain
LEKHIESACETLGLWPDATFRLHVGQLEELLSRRHCVFVIGEPGVGKSECITTLQLAWSTMRGFPVKMVDLNPKVVSTEDLYGHMHLTTREWKDGLLSKVMRELAHEDIKDQNKSFEQSKWLILDGYGTYTITTHSRCDLRYVSSVRYSVHI